LEYFIITETEHVDTVCIEVLGPRVVVGSLVQVIVNCAVEFDSKLLLFAVEIEDIRTDAMLTPKLSSTEAAVS